MPHPFLSLGIPAVAVVAFAVLTLTPALRRSGSWAATITPLASIMGSGFLVCAPLLASAVGNLAPLVMAGLLGLAFLIGGAIRFNIRCRAEDAPGEEEPGAAPAPDEPDHALHRAHRDHASRPRPHAGWAPRVEGLSHFVLAGAYVVSVTYYIQLLAHFTLHAVGREGTLAARGLGSAVLAGIALTGFFFGLKIIERVEKHAINLNLAMIAALLAGLAAHNLGLWRAGDWVLPDLPGTPDRWQALRVAMGLLIVVQGFETSRFLGKAHPPEQRIRTMAWAQGLSTAIYLVFLLLLLPVMTPELASADAGVTAIVTLAGSVALVLPLMISVAAVGSQFSAAVADEAGCGGLLEALGLPWVDGRRAYLLIGALTCALCWAVDVEGVIAWASRAFALFYSAQCLVAASNALHHRGRVTARLPRCALYATLALACLGVATLSRATG